ncbi:MAG: hypothetical protein U0229_10580 [Anaeromyxobacter sp.]
MTSPLAARRLEVFLAARADAGFLRLSSDRLRFSLGTSLADLKVPVEVAADVRAIVQGALVEAALLVSSQHRNILGAELTDRIILRDEFARMPQPPAQLSAPGGNPDLRTAAQTAPAVHPALWGGLVGAWMGKGGRGRSLVALWIELLRRGFEEMRRWKRHEETPYLVALVLASETLAAERALRDALPPPPVDRWVSSAAMAAGWLAARTGLARAWRDAGLDHADPLLARLEAVLSPGAIAGARAAAATGGLTVYGCELLAGIPAGDAHAEALAGGADPADVEALVRQAIDADREVARAAEQAVAEARLRDMLGEGIVRAEADGLGPALDPLRRRFTAPGAIAATIEDEAERAAFEAELAALGKRTQDGPLTPLARTLSRWRPKDPAASVGLGHGAARDGYARAAAAYLCDVALERRVAQARRHLVVRTGREAEGGAQVEWEAGRLYRFSVKPGRILQDRPDKPVAHLFADMKDFTRRTELLGQAAMAEFLRSAFYGPILTMAREHAGGMTHLSDRGGVAVNNLMGDAISLSGEIGPMVGVARGIRAHLAGMAARLAREVSQEAIARELAAIEAAHGEAAARAAAARAQLEEALAAEPPGTPRHAALWHRAARARAEEDRVRGERERALARARGEELEAGVFLSFGAPPVVVVVDDEIFGVNRVAVAEKINESARGTARVPSARSRADAALARERARSGGAELAHAWSVFVGQPLAIPIPPDLEEAALRQLRLGDGAGAMRTLSPPVREALDRLGRQDVERPGDVWNGGAAVSEEALEAFLADAGATRTVKRLELELEAIPRALRDRWFYGEEPLTLVACFEAGSGRLSELFRRVGRAAFKGMAGVTVWELCAEGGGPGALAAALAPSWR